MQGIDRVRPTVERIARKLNDILELPFIDQHTLSNVAITTSFQNIPHGLGRAIQGWILIDNNANSVIYRDTVAANNPDVTKFIRLKGSASATVSILVF